MKRKVLLIVAASTMLLTLTTSCIKDDTNEVELNENVNNDDIKIDESFKASDSYLQASWQGEYSGYDENQKANTNIRRLLILNADGSYTNTIQGILVSKNSDKNEYTDFEKEYGTYTYNGSDLVTYNVTTDSLINYQTNELQYFSKKHSYSGSDTDTTKDVASYTEGVKFQTKDNDHQWVTKDVYLSNLKGADLELYFIMKKE